LLLKAPSVQSEQRVITAEGADLLAAGLAAVGALLFSRS
jgi:hypothetical protein